MINGMRIVAINNSRVWVQSRTGDKWEQCIVQRKTFEIMMRLTFPKYVAEYESSDTDMDMADYFYNYGETEEMIRKGESYIFKPYFAD